MSKTVSFDDIEPKWRKKAEAVFDELGITASEAINSFFKDVAEKKYTPFKKSKQPQPSKKIDLHDRGSLPVSKNIPNAETIKAFEEHKRGKGKTFKNIEEFREELYSIWGED